jgi:hypothetical protein
VTFRYLECEIQARFRLYSGTKVAATQWILCTTDDHLQLMFKLQESGNIQNLDGIAVSECSDTGSSDGQGLFKDSESRWSEDIQST